MSTKEQYWKYSLITIIIGLGIILARQITPFLGGLLGALTIYILVRRQMIYLSEKRKIKRTIAATVITAEAILCFLVPLALVVWLAVVNLQNINLSSISEYAKFDNNTFKLMKRNLPGAFTFILNGTVRLPKIFRNRKEVGIRMPDHPIIQELARLLDAPIMTATLPHDENEDIEYCTDPELIDEKFGNIVDLVIDGGIGGIEGSTVVDCTGGEAEIVRQGKGWLDEG